MNTRKTLSLPNRPNKVVLTKSDLSPPPSDGYRMDEWGTENRGFDSRPMDNRPMNYPRGPRGDRGNRYGRQGGRDQRHDHGRSHDHRGNEHRGNEHRGNEHRGNDSRGNEEAHTNKIRRGPGRRLAKEKRMRSMDPALLQKYAALSPALQEKVNATIEIYYQQQMARVYKGQADEEAVEEDHFEADVVYDADENLEV